MPQHEDAYRLPGERPPIADGVHIVDVQEGGSGPGFNTTTVAIGRGHRVSISGIELDLGASFKVGNEKKWGHGTGFGRIQPIMTDAEVPPGFGFTVEICDKLIESSQVEEAEPILLLRPNTGEGAMTAIRHGSRKKAIMEGSFGLFLHNTFGASVYAADPTVLGGSWPEYLAEEIELDDTPTAVNIITSRETGRASLRGPDGYIDVRKETLVGRLSVGPLVTTHMVGPKYHAINWSVEIPKNEPATAGVLGLIVEASGRVEAVSAYEEDENQDVSGLAGTQKLMPSVAKRRS